MCNILNKSWLWRQEVSFASGQTDRAELQVCPPWTIPQLILCAVGGCHIQHLSHCFAALPVNPAHETGLCFQDHCYHFMSVWWSSCFLLSLLKCWLFRNSWHLNKCNCSKKNSKCWIHWLLPTQLLSVQCCCFWHAAVLHCAFIVFFSLPWEQVVVLLGLCVTGASFTIAQSSVSRDSELSLRFQTGLECVWGSVISTQLLFSVTNSCWVLALKCFHCWRSNFQKVSCPLNSSCTVFLVSDL